MAMKIDSDTELIQSASLTGAVTTAFWWRRPAAAMSGQLFAFASFALEAASTGIKLAGTGDDTDVEPASGDWVYLALIQNGGGFSVYAWEDIVSETMHTITSAYNPGTMSQVLLGDVAGIYGVGYTDAEHLHLRVWNTALTTAQLNTERQSATPVITSGLILDVPLASEPRYGWRARMMTAWLF